MRQNSVGPPKYWCGHVKDLLLSSLACQSSGEVWVYGARIHEYAARLGPGFQERVDNGLHSRIIRQHGEHNSAVAGQICQAHSHSCAVLITCNGEGKPC
jgi:hypothetical protein